MLWNLFLATKSRSGKTHYKLRRTCGKCDEPICDENKSGYCMGCGRGKNPQLKRHGRIGGVESAKHIKLKKIAGLFLKRMGCEGIKEECSFNGNNLRIDVVGMLKGRVIGVECGGSRTLRAKSKIIDELYVLPYGESFPFLWSKRADVCARCGHRV